MATRDFKGKSCSRHDSPVHIRYYVVPNANRNSGGFMPIYRSGRHEHGNTYGVGGDRAQALRAAKAGALREARRYKGDFCVTVKQGTSRVQRRDGSIRSIPRRR